MDEDLAQRGGEIYERAVRPRTGAEDDGKFVAIDLQTGLFAIDRHDAEAVRLLRERSPSAQVWLTRVGHRYAYRFGVRGIRESIALGDRGADHD